MKFKNYLALLFIGFICLVLQADAFDQANANLERGGMEYEFDGLAKNLYAADDDATNIRVKRVAKGGGGRKGGGGGGKGKGGGKKGGGGGGKGRGGGGGKKG